MRAKLITASVASAVVLAAAAAVLLIVEHLIGSRCQRNGGDDCQPPSALSSGVFLDANDRRLHVFVGCGGRLQAIETADRVSVKFTRHTFPGGMGVACAWVDVHTELGRALGSRIVVDGVSGRRLGVLSVSRLDSPDPRVARPISAYRVIALPRSPLSAPVPRLPPLDTPAIARDYQVIAGRTRLTLVRTLDPPSFTAGGWTIDPRRSSVHGAPAQLWHSAAASALFWQHGGLSYLVSSSAGDRAPTSTLLRLAEAIGS